MLHPLQPRHHPQHQQQELTTITITTTTTTTTTTTPMATATTATTSSRALTWTVAIQKGSILGAWAKSFVRKFRNEFPSLWERWASLRTNLVKKTTAVILRRH